MTSLIACDGCRRHVRPDETECPFCGATVHGEPRPPMRKRFSRFAIATGLALAACSAPGGDDDAGREDGGRIAVDAGKEDAGREDDAGRDAGDDAGDDAGHDAGYDAGMIFPPYGTPAIPDGGV